MSKPWMKFYPADWQADPAVRSCSLMARGLWVEMLCLMQKSEPIGHLLVNGNAPKGQTLATLSGASKAQVEKGLAELEAAGVFSRTESGVIYSRRMVRDELRALAAHENGAKGGNPTLKPWVNPPVNPEDKPGVDEGVKPQKLEARIQKESPLPPKGARKASATKIPDGYPDAEAIAVQQDRCRAARVDVNVHYQAERFRGWAEGKDARYAKWPATWRNWITKSIEDVTEVGRSSGYAPPDDNRPIDWARRMKYWRDDSFWMLAWGPRPDHKQCQCPPDLLAAA